MKGNCNDSTCCETTATARPVEAPRTFRPNVDVVEYADKFVLTADLPGATHESIELNFEGGVLALKASVTPRTPGNTNQVYREYAVGDYQRQFRLGDDVNPEAIGAEFANGVLTLTVPKREAAQARRIEVQAR